MRLYDSIYGEYETNKDLDWLIKTPVVQRLRWIALSNIPSLTYPMISGVSRYVHSIGVSHLAGIVGNELSLGAPERINLACAGLLHDAGMPPLGHITEEALSSVGIKFDHEESLKMILLDEGRRFQQMPDGEKIGVTEAISKARGDSSEIFKAIMGEGELGQYISSSMDVDNVDNVIRLYRLIFPREDGYCPYEIVKGYFSEAPGFEDYKSKWDEVRAKLYTKLMFSIEDFGQKATLKRLIKTYLNIELQERDEREVIDSIRFLNDGQFLGGILSRLSETESGCGFYSGRYDRVVSYGWVDEIDKSRLVSIKDELTADNYYIDFIPDKRFKNVDAKKARGALLGLFSFGKVGKSRDAEIISNLIQLVPEYQEGYTPIDALESDQLSLI